MSPAFLGLATVIATLVGPIAAVIVTRYVDGRRARETLQLDIFRTLMGRRRMQLSQEFVVALNRIEVEFHDRPEVITKWKDLLAVFGRDRPINEGQGQKLREDIDTKLAAMLETMAKVLNVKVPTLDILRGGYRPSGHDTVEGDQHAVLWLFAEIARGNRALPIDVRSLPPQPPTQPPATA
jgi:hypothetical protein